MTNNKLKEVTSAYKQTSIERFNLTTSARKKIINQSLNFMMMNGEMYDTTTGEYIGDKYQLPDYLLPIKKKNPNYIKRKANDDAIKQHTDAYGGFVWCLFNSNLQMMNRFPSLNKKDIARLLYLATYVHYKDSVLQKGDGTKITTDSIHALIKLSKKRGKEFIDKLLHEQIIKIDNKLIYISPEVFYKGQIKDIKNITKDLHYIRLFRNTVRQLFNDAKENEIAHIATIYSVLPYINLNHNYICSNPKEEDIEHIKMIDTMTLCEKLNYSSYNKMMSHFRKLTVNDEPVFNFFEDVNDRRKRNIVVNPKVVYAGNNAEYLKALNGLFIKNKNTNT